MIRVEFFIEGDIVVAYGRLVDCSTFPVSLNWWIKRTSNNDLDLEIRLLHPFNRPLELCQSPLLG